MHPDEPRTERASHFQVDYARACTIGLCVYVYARACVCVRVCVCGSEITDRVRERDDVRFFGSERFDRIGD